MANTTENTTVVSIPKHVRTAGDALLKARTSAVSAFGAVVASVVAYIDDGETLDDAASAFRTAHEADMTERLDALDFPTEGFTFGQKGARETGAEHSTEARDIIATVLSTRATVSRAKTAIEPNLTKTGRVSKPKRSRLDAIIAGDVTVKAATSKPKASDTGRLKLAEANKRADAIIEKARADLAAIAERLTKSSREKWAASVAEALDAVVDGSRIATVDDDS